MYCTRCNESGVLTTFNGVDYYYYCRGCKEELVLEPIPVPPKQSGEPQIEWPAYNPNYCTDPACYCNQKAPSASNGNVAATPSGAKYFNPQQQPTSKNLTQDQIDELFKIIKGVPLQVIHITELDKVYD